MCNQMETSEIRQGFHARFVEIPRNTFIWWRNFFNLDTSLALISSWNFKLTRKLCANILANLSPMIIMAEIVAKILENLPAFMVFLLNISPRWPAPTDPGFPRMIWTLRRKGIINSPWRKEIIYKMSVLFKVYVPTLIWRILSTCFYMGTLWLFYT